MGVSGTRVEDVVCPFCGCLCDDLIVEVEGEKVLEVQNACITGEKKFTGSKRLKSPIERTRNDWFEISYEKAIDRTVEILLDADRPLLFGWSNSFEEAQLLGVRIAGLIGGVIDNTASIYEGPAVPGFEELRHQGCTLEQVKEKADVVVYWGCDPVMSHPRHMSRYTTYARYLFLDNSFRKRTVIVFDARKTSTSNLADEFVKIDPGCDYAVLSALRVIFLGKKDLLPAFISGVLREQLVHIAELIKNSRVCAFFIGQGLSETRGKFENIRNVVELARELNKHTETSIFPMWEHGNIYSAKKVLNQISGYPSSVDFARGVGYYNPGETTAVDVLARNECDACLIVGSDPGAILPRPCCQHLAQIPTIQIDPHINATTHLSKIQIPTAQSGIDAEGVYYRMDGTPVPIKKLYQSGYPSDAEVLKRIYIKIMDSKGVKP